MTKTRLPLKKHANRILAFTLVFVVLFSLLPSSNLAETSGVRVDPETGAVIDENSNQPISYEDWQSLFMPLMSVAPSNTSFAYESCLDSLSVAQISALVSETYQGKNYKPKLTFKTLNGNKFREGSMTLLPSTSITTYSGDKDNDTLQIGLQLGNSPIATLTDYFSLLTGTVQVDITDKNGESSSFQYRLSTDTALLSLVDSHLINNWSDVLFYKAAAVTASASPKITSAMPVNEEVTLNASVSSSAPAGICYLWQQVAISSDGSIPESGWTNTGMTAQNPVLYANTNTIKYAYRVLAFPDTASRAGFENGTPCLYTVSNPVTLMSDADRAVLFPDILSEGVTWGQVQYLLAIANFPGTFTITPDYVLDESTDYLTLNQLASLADGTIPATAGKVAGYSITFTIDTDDQHKFYSCYLYSGEFGDETTLLGSVVSDKADKKQCSVTINSGSGFTAAQLFAMLLNGSIYAKLTDANGQVQSKAFDYHITADNQLQGLLNAGLVANWSDLYFYRSAQGTASVNPETAFDTASDSTAALLLNVPNDPNGTTYRYLWQKALIRTDGTMPDAHDTWENMTVDDVVIGTKDTSTIVNLDTLRYAYRAQIFPNDTARTNYLNGDPTLSVTSNIVTLIPEEKRSLVYPAAFAENFTWDDLQFLLSDGVLIADVYLRSQTYSELVDNNTSGSGETLSAKDTDGGKHAVSPDYMMVTLTAGVGGAESYEWQRKPTADSSAAWTTFDTTTEPTLDMHMDASTATYTYRCVCTKGENVSTTTESTFDPLPGTIWGNSLGNNTYWGYLPATGNTAANYNAYGDSYNSHNNRGQYAFNPAQDPNPTQYVSDGKGASLTKTVPEEEGKRGNENTNREYTIYLEADFADLKEPDPIVYLISSDMDYATSDLLYARNWDNTIFNIGTGSEIKNALVRFVDYVTSDGSGSFVGFSYTGHDNLPGSNYLYASPYFTNTNTTAVNGFNTLHTYGVCGNGHWDSGFSQLATCFEDIDRSAVETYLFGNDANRIESIQRVGISIAGSNENGYTGNSKTITDLFGQTKVDKKTGAVTGYIDGQDFWYGILTTDGTGNHWLNNSVSTMSGLFTGKITEDAIYDALISIYNERVNPSVSHIVFTDIVRAEFEVVAPDGAAVSITNGVKTVTWTDTDGDVYTAVCNVDTNGNKAGETTVTILHDSKFYYTKSESKKLTKSIDIKACEDYIGSNDVHTNHDPATITYINQVGQEKTGTAEQEPTVNVPVRVMIPNPVKNWLLKGDATDLDALGEDFIQAVKDYVYKYEQVSGTLNLEWLLGNESIAYSDPSVHTDSARSFPETDTTTNSLSNVKDATSFTGKVFFTPDPATNGKTSVYLEDGTPLAQAQVTVVPVAPNFAPQSDAVWLGEPLKAHNASGWAVASVAERFAPSLPAKTSIADITDEAYSRLSNRLDDEEYLSRLNFTLCNSDWTEVSENPITGDTVIEDLESVGFTKEYKLAVCSLLNGEEIPLYDSTHTVGTYPVYAIYQAKPIFNVWSYTMGLTKNSTATSIPIVRSGSTGLVSSAIPATAPAWASSQQALWTMLRNSFSAYQNSLIYSFTESTEENPTVIGLQPDEMLTTDGTNLLLTEQHGHDGTHPIVPDIEVRLTGNVEPFYVLNPHLYVVDCKLTIVKYCENIIGSDWDPDWRFPVDVSGPGLSGLTVILAPDGQVTIGDLPAGTYTAAENAPWIHSIGTGDSTWGLFNGEAWTDLVGMTHTGTQNATLSIWLRPENGGHWDWVKTPVYRSDNQMATVDTSSNSKTLTIVNTYTDTSRNTYLEEHVTNVYQNGSWRQK